MSAEQIDVRNRILSRLSQLGWSRYRLSKNCPNIPPTTMYEFLAEKHEIHSGHIGKMLAALGLDITPTEGSAAKSKI